MKKAAGPNGPTAKKKDPPAQCRKADEIYLRLQKNAPFPTRQWRYVLWFSCYRKITFLGKTRSIPQHPSTKHTSMAIKLKTGNERRVLGFATGNQESETRNLHFKQPYLPKPPPNRRRFSPSQTGSAPSRINRNHPINQISTHSF